METTTPLFLQYLNIMISGISLVIMIVAAIAYGRLTKTVEVHDKEIINLWKAQREVEGRVYTIATGLNDKR